MVASAMLCARPMPDSSIPPHQTGIPAACATSCTPPTTLGADKREDLTLDAGIVSPPNKVGDFVWVGGDCHLYLNHLEQVETQLSRTPYPLPKLVIRRRPPSLYDYRYEDLELTDYQSHPAIRAAVAV